MQLSEQTITTLKNFSSINPNLVFKAGNQIKTISVAKNILATATIPETIPKEFGIYDLNEFLNVISMFDDPTLDITSNSAKITYSGGESTNYYFSDVSNLTAPTKDISMPQCEIEFDMTESTLNKIRKAAATLGVSEVVVTGEADGSGVDIVVHDTRNVTSNSLTLKLTENVIRPDAAFKMVFNISNFKFASGDYRAKLSSKLISNFKHANGTLEYWVALEKTSTFNA